MHKHNGLTCDQSISLKSKLEIRKGKVTLGTGRPGDWVKAFIIV